MIVFKYFHEKSYLFSDAVSELAVAEVNKNWLFYLHILNFIKAIISGCTKCS